MTSGSPFDPAAGKTDHLPLLIAKMTREALPSAVIDTFSHYYYQIQSGETGLLPEAELSPVGAESIADFNRLHTFTAKGHAALPKAVKIVLNGGLGTSMGLQAPKSLLTVKKGLTFLDIILRQAQSAGVRLALMNSFSTHEPTVAALRQSKPDTMPLMFQQHKFPKLMRHDLSPAVWPANPALEWNPPGHGDIYIALHTSGVLDTLLAEGVTYALISNSDNLGATLDESLLGYFADRDLPFMMEVARRTPADKKGGHIARHQSGHLILREIAQCPETEQDAFQDIERYRFFNTNNLWINLEILWDLIQSQKTIKLPLMLNPKVLDPRNTNSPPVYQVETAMGAAISLFDGASAVVVPESRFFPVKKCNDLLAVGSDCYNVDERYHLQVNLDRPHLPRVKVELDPRYYGKIDQLQARFGAGFPSLLHCETLVVEGDIYFEANVQVKGRVKIENKSDTPVTIEAGAVLTADRCYT